MHKNPPVPEETIEERAEKLDEPYEVTTAFTPYGEGHVPGCAPAGYVGRTGEEIAVDSFVRLLDDKDLEAMASRGITVEDLKKPDRTNEKYRPLFQHGTGTYFTVVDFGTSTFQAILLDERAQKRITLAMEWGSRLDRAQAFLGRFWKLFRGR